MAMAGCHGYECGDDHDEEKFSVQCLSDLKSGLRWWWVDQQ